MFCLTISSELNRIVFSDYIILIILEFEKFSLKKLIFRRLLNLSAFTTKYINMFKVIFKKTIQINVEIAEFFILSQKIDKVE